MLSWLVDPWTWGAWMWRGMLSVTLVAVACAVLGVFLYLRRMSLVADALAHVALPGIVAAFLISGSLSAPVMLFGAALTGLLATVGIETLSRRPNIRPDAAIGIVFTAMFAAGVILLSTRVQDAHIDTHCLLFGDVLGVSDRSIWLLAFVTPLVLVLVAVFYRWLSASSFDPGFAKSLGIPVAAVHYGLMTAVSLTTVASFEAVGAILVIALIIVPAATAHRLSDRLHLMLAFAVAHGVVSATVGMYVAIWIDSSAAGAIVVTGGLIYAAVFLFGPRHGLVFSPGRHCGQGLGPEASSINALEG
ncbi:MAG: metal ABC transporter permease [Bradymonadaceae bacterium]|nr:metal ABC transporter permease [Lujinxingiaceae bacterium]